MDTKCFRLLLRLAGTVSVGSMLAVAAAGGNPVLLLPQTYQFSRDLFDDLLQMPPPYKDELKEWSKEFCDNVAVIGPRVNYGAQFRKAQDQVLKEYLPIYWDEYVDSALYFAGRIREKHVCFSQMVHTLREVLPDFLNRLAALPKSSSSRSIDLLDTTVDSLIWHLNTLTSEKYSHPTINLNKLLVSSVDLLPGAAQVLSLERFANQGWKTEHRKKQADTQAVEIERIIQEVECKNSMTFDGTIRCVVGQLQRPYDWMQAIAKRLTEKQIKDNGPQLKIMFDRLAEALHKIFPVRDRMMVLQGEIAFPKLVTHTWDNPANTSIGIPFWQLFRFQPVTDNVGEILEHLKTSQGVPEFYEKVFKYIMLMHFRRDLLIRSCDNPPDIVLDLTSVNMTNENELEEFLTELVETERGKQNQVIAVNSCNTIKPHPERATLIDELAGALRKHWRSICFGGPDGVPVHHSLDNSPGQHTHSWNLDPYETERDTHSWDLDDPRLSFNPYETERGQPTRQGNLRAPKQGASNDLKPKSKEERLKPKPESTQKEHVRWPLPALDFRDSNTSVPLQFQMSPSSRLPEGLVSVPAASVESHHCFPSVTPRNGTQGQSAAHVLGQPTSPQLASVTYQPKFAVPVISPQSEAHVLGQPTHQGNLRAQKQVASNDLKPIISVTYQPKSAASLTRDSVHTRYSPGTVAAPNHSKPAGLPVSVSPSSPGAQNHSKPAGLPAATAAFDWFDNPP